MKKTGKSPIENSQFRSDDSMAKISFNEMISKFKLLDPKINKPRRDRRGPYNHAWSVFSILTGVVDMNERVYLDVSHGVFMDQYYFTPSSTKPNVASWLVKNKILTREYDIIDGQEANLANYTSIVSMNSDVDIYQLISKEQLKEVMDYFEMVFDREIEAESINEDEY